MNRELTGAVWERAKGCCEYCCVSQFDFPVPFQIDHIIAEKHGGKTVESNLALACPHCNLYKGPNIAGRDVDTSQIIRLYHPRADQWHDHFAFDGPWIIGLTEIGRVTVQVLAMNAEDMLALRAESLRESRNA